MTTPDTTARAPRIDPAWTVNEVVRRHPATVAVFNAFGLDACCGADLGALVAALEAVAGGWGGAPLPLTTIAPRRGVR
jgi:hypothetical protein